MEVNGRVLNIQPVCQTTVSLSNNCRTIELSKVCLQYQVIKEAVFDAFYRLTNARSQITAYVFDVVRAIVPKSDLDDVFTTKEEVRLVARLHCTASYWHLTRSKHW